MSCEDPRERQFPRGSQCRAGSVWGKEQQRGALAAAEGAWGEKQAVCGVRSSSGSAGCSRGRLGGEAGDGV